LCGADLVESFGIPNVWRTEDLMAILNNHGVVALERKGVDIPRIVFEHDILFENSSKIITVNSRIDNDVSSSKIRRFLGRGFSVKYCIPDPVLDYIKEHELYSPQSIKRDIRDFGDKK
jgi:nicotinamide mononucleotide adenylyltransferase